jgi:MFS family permease
MTYPEARMPDAPARKLLVICLASAGWSFGFGLGAPLASLWLQDAGHTPTVIGLNTGIYYLGIALAAGAVPWLMRRLGHGCPVLGMVLSGLTVALFPWAGSLGGWFGLRLVNGLAGALSLIPMETLVNRESPPARRARNFGFYAFSVAGGWALGNLVGLQMYQGAARGAFALGGAVSVAAGLVIALWMPPLAEVAEEQHGRQPLPLAPTFLSWGSAWSQGFLEGGMVALLPVYLLFLGMSDVGVSWLTSGIMIGVILFQVPVAWLADRVGRSAMLVGCYLVVATGLALLPFCSNFTWSLQAGPPWLAVWLLLVGACSGAFYPLGLALLGSRIPPSGLARASALYLGINCVGSLTGPVVTGVVMDRFGDRAMFLAGEAAVLLVLFTWVGLRLRARRQATVPRGEGHAVAVETPDAA